MKFELTLVCKVEGPTSDMHSIDMVVADDLVHLLAQFMILIVTVQRRVIQTETDRRVIDEDIPF